jgi:hypothetical protein
MMGKILSKFSCCGCFERQKAEKAQPVLYRHTEIIKTNKELEK